MIQLRDLALFALGGLVLPLLPFSTAVAAPGDTEGPVEVNVTTPAGTAPRPDLNVRVPNFELKTEVFTFPSGFRAMFQNDDSQPIIAITSVTDHGASDDPVGKEGIAHLVEHLWFRSEQGDLPKTWDILESELGCNLNAFTQYDITAYMTVCSSRHLEAMLKLESLRITDTIANVTEEMVTTEIEVVRNEIRMRTENFNIPFFTVWEYANGHMFDETYPYSRPMAGDHTTIRNIKLADVQTFTDSYYRPDTTTTVVVGDMPSSDPAFYLDLMVKSFDLALLHPDLSEEHIRQMPRADISEPDPANPDHWWLIPMNPEKPDEVLPYLVEQTPRALQFDSLIPPDPVTGELGVYEGPVEKPTVVVAWTMPPGYQGQDTLLQITGNILSFVTGIGMSRVEDPDVREFQGCGALPSKRSTTVICFAHAKSNDANAERIASRMIDQVVTLYDPALRGSLDSFFSRGRMEFLARTLRSLDLYAAVGAGRATDIATYAHFTGNPRFHSAQMVEAMQLQSFQVAELAGKWLKRNRAAMLFIKPMERDEVALLSEDTEGSGGHARGGGDGPILNPSTDPALLTDEYIRSLMDLPDVSKIDDFKLPNGLRVVIMPHTESPLVRASVYVNGGHAHDDFGMSEYVDLFSNSDAPDPLQIAGAWSGYTSSTARMVGIKASSGNVDGALWMLRERIDTMKAQTTTFVENVGMAGRPTYIKRRRSRLKARWRDADWHRSNMLWQHVNPGHPLHDSTTWEDLDILAKKGAKDITAAIDKTWQPANATLLVVGNVEPKKARAFAIKYFGGWQPAGGITPETLDPIPGPNPASETGIYVFDDEGKTQTTVQLVCPIRKATTEPSAIHDLLSGVTRTALFARLREEAGVVYSPQAAAITYPGGTAFLYMRAAIQNDSAVFALKEYLAFVELVMSGGLAESDVRLKKLGMASGYVLRQQSIDQMTSRLSGPIVNGRPWSDFERYADELSAVSPSDFAPILEGCAEHAFITFVGPKDSITAQLDEAKLEYEVVDYEQRGKDMWKAVDPKGFEKYEKKKAKEEAKEAKKKGEEDGEEEDAESSEEE